MIYCVSVSGGLGSFVAAEIAIAEYGRENVRLVFCDTLIEDPDLYRFLDDTEKALGLNILRLKDGRNPWEVFRDVKFMGNSRTAHCSSVLKRDVFEEWIKRLSGPVTLILGIDWTEEHRLVRARANWTPIPVEAPLCKYPLTKAQIVARVEAYGIKIPELYGKGFAHNNCGGFCVRAGQAHFANLLDKYPLRYLWHEKAQEKLMREVPTTRPFLQKTTNKVREYLTLRQFRERLQAGDTFDKFDLGGCGCFVNDPKPGECATSEVDE